MLNTAQKKVAKAGNTSSECAYCLSVRICGWHRQGSFSLKNTLFSTICAAWLFFAEGNGLCKAQKDRSAAWSGIRRCGKAVLYSDCSRDWRRVALPASAKESLGFQGRSGYVSDLSFARSDREGDWIFGIGKGMVCSAGACTCGAHLPWSIPGFWKGEEKSTNCSVVSKEILRNSFIILQGHLKSFTV